MEARKVKRLDSIAGVGKVADDFYEELRKAPQKAKKVAWCGGYPTPFPILRAMDIAYLFEDVYAATAAARHKEKKLQEISADRGYLPEVCSYARTTFGSAYFPEEEKPEADPYYLMPKPDFLIFVDPGCSMLPNWSDAGRRLFDAPLFGIHVPYVWKRAEEEEAIQEVAHQFRELITFLEDMTQRHFNWNAFREMMVGVKEAITLRMEAMELAGRAIPSPVTFFDWAASLGAVNYAVGTPYCPELFRKIKEEIEDRIARKEGALPKERCRVYWEGHMCWPYMRWWGELLAELGVNIIAAKYTHLCFFHRPDRIDPEEPLESLAANSVCALGYSIDLLAEEILRFCQDYSIDAVVCHSTRTCRIFPGPFFEIMDIISRKLGIPGVFFEGDVADASFFAPAQARTRLEALAEIVASKKKAIETI